MIKRRLPSDNDQMIKQLNVQVSARQEKIIKYPKQFAQICNSFYANVDT